MWQYWKIAVVVVVAVWLHTNVAKSVPTSEPTATQLQAIWDICRKQVGTTNEEFELYTQEKAPINRRTVCLSICFIHRVGEYIQEDDDDIKTEDIANRYNCKLD